MLVTQGYTQINTRFTRSPSFLMLIFSAMERWQALFAGAGLEFLWTPLSGFFGAYY